MKVRYQINDGYVGGARPQRCDVDDGDLADCDTWDEAKNLILEVVDEDMMQKIEASIGNMSELEAAWRELRQGRQAAGIVVV